MYQCINSGLHNQDTPPGQNVIIREESYWFCYEYRVKKKWIPNKCCTRFHADLKDLMSSLNNFL